MANILETHPSNWEYISEGGASIVFSYIGCAHPDFSGMVLRLRKRTTTSAEWTASGPHSETFSSNDFDDPIIAFQTCMQKLIPPEHLPRLQRVNLEKSWLKEFAELHEDSRPEERRLKDSIDFERTTGLLATDLVGGDRLAVEIKPKWGFLPSPMHLSDETKAVKRRTCRYCMHSRLKADETENTSTDYCPLDLFSGDEMRIAQAVRSLWNAWVLSNATMNNLKLFSRGHFVKPSEAHLMLKGSDESELGAIRDLFVAALVPQLLDSPVLGLLSKLQRDLDPLDIEGLIKLWRLSKPLQNENVDIDIPSAGLISQPNISDWEDFLDAYTERELDHAYPSTGNLQYYIMAYLLSATFKDCSIIIELKFLEPGVFQSKELDPPCVKIIDLDPKSVDKLKHWEKMDRKIAQNYALLKEEKICNDNF